MPHSITTPTTYYKRKSHSLPVPSLGRAGEVASPPNSATSTMPLQPTNSSNQLTNSTISARTSTTTLLIARNTQSLSYSYSTMAQKSTLCARQTCAAQAGSRNVSMSLRYTRLRDLNLTMSLSSMPLTVAIPTSTPLPSTRRRRMPANST